jgi:hypothetical protein
MNMDSADDLLQIRPIVRMLHISYPSYWVFEGKVDPIRDQE